MRPPTVPRGRRLVIESGPSSPPAQVFILLGFLFRAAFLKTATGLLEHCCMYMIDGCVLPATERVY